jgi:hypothetical protein
MPTGQLAILLRATLAAAFIVASSAPAFAQAVQNTFGGGCASNSEPVSCVTPTKKDQYSTPWTEFFLESGTDQLDETGEPSPARFALAVIGLPPAVVGHRPSHAREHPLPRANPPTGPPFLS